MQHIYDPATSRVLWSGPAYIVDGAPGIVDPPLVLLDEVNPEPPQYDPSTQTLEQSRSADLAAKEWRTVWTIRDLTPEEIRRDHPLVESLRLALGKSPEQVDAIIADISDELWGYEHAIAVLDTCNFNILPQVN